MKTLKIWSLVALMFIGLASCEPTNGPEAPAEGLDKIVNEWVLISWGGEDAKYRVYIDFNDDNTFTIYQQVYSLNYVMYTGTYTLSGSTLSGVYDDGSVWKTDYQAAITNEGTLLSLTSIEEVSTVGVYSTTVIPEDVKVEAEDTRSEEGVEWTPFL